MGEGLFGGGRRPATQAPVIPPPAPVRDDMAGTAAAERQRLAAQRGRASTLLSGNYQAAPAGQRVLLGMGQ